MPEVCWHLSDLSDPFRTLSIKKLSTWPINFFYKSPELKLLLKGEYMKLFLIISLIFSFSIISNQSFAGKSSKNISKKIKNQGKNGGSPDQTKNGGDAGKNGGDAGKNSGPSAEDIEGLNK
jgi:hypothetical protein